MRVIAGIYKGRVLRMPKDIESLRPTKQRVREALFEIIKPYLAGSDVLELFAGTGSLGIEALSRGAKSITLVERDPECFKAIEYNLDMLKLAPPEASLIRVEAFRAINKFVENNEKFGIIIADPPYGMDHIRKLLIKLGSYDILKKPHLLVLEHFIKEDIPQKEGHLILLKQYKYGDSVLSILSKGAQQ